VHDFFAGKMIRQRPATVTLLPLLSVRRFAAIIMLVQTDIFVGAIVRRNRIGQALACADYLGVGSDQIVVGWRAMNDPGVPGIKLFTPLNKSVTKWREDRISSEKVAVEDIKAADLIADGKVDIVAAARHAKNLVVFFNER
jgi:hypothetical protein